MKEINDPEDLKKPTMVRSYKEIFHCGDYTIFWHPINNSWMLFQGNQRIDQDQFCSDLCERNGFRLG